MVSHPSGLQGCYCSLNKHTDQPTHYLTYMIYGITYGKSSPITHTVDPAHLTNRGKSSPMCCKKCRINHPQYLQIPATYISPHCANRNTDNVILCSSLKEIGSIYQLLFPCESVHVCMHLTVSR